jgi:4-hydroxy-3-methylbut-2-en-1-yl diphosphate reductase
VEALEDPGTPIAMLAQTTLSHDDWSDVLDATKERFPELWMPGRSDLCFATTNRQAALREVARQSDAVVVVGSSNSSNTVALAKVAAGMGVKTVVRVNGPDELPDGLSGSVAVTAGASAPDDVVRAVIDRLAPINGVEAVRAVEEEEYFPPPRELRELMDVLSTGVLASLGGPAPSGVAFPNDRSIGAKDVLATLAH